MSSEYSTLDLRPILDEKRIREFVERLQGITPEEIEEIVELVLISKKIKLG